MIQQFVNYEDNGQGRRHFFRIERTDVERGDGRERPSQQIPAALPGSQINEQSGEVEEVTEDVVDVSGIKIERRETGVITAEQRGHSTHLAGIAEAPGDGIRQEDVRGQDEQVREMKRERTESHERVKGPVPD